MSFDFDPTSPQQQLDPNPEINDASIHWWTAQTRQNAERAVIAGREADMALHVARTASNMAIAAAAHLIRDNILANNRMAARTYTKLLDGVDFTMDDGVTGGRDEHSGEHPGASAEHGLLPGQAPDAANTANSGNVAATAKMAAAAPVAFSSLLTAIRPRQGRPRRWSGFL
ncbi:unnamed protein product [Symbiodinium microadriaticum]|nr:unnamed protein product [Symbiodinium microadriaticum]